MARVATNALDAAAQLLACLTVTVQAAENPPANIQFLPGAQAGEDLSVYNDLCCDGTAYVRMSTLYPSFQDFPAPDTLAIACQQQASALVYEIGIMRCSPTGDINHVPTAAAWAASFRQQMIDAQSMYKAACCYSSFYNLDAILMGAWSPIGPNGGCLLGTLGLTHQIAGCGGLCQ